MHILAVTSHEMAAFAVCAAIFALYIAGYFCWLMYRIYKLNRRELTWLDYSHLLGLFVFMFLLNMMKREYYAGLPLPLEAKQVEEKSHIRLGPAKLLNAISFNINELKGYIVNVELAEDKVNEFASLNQMKLGQEQDKNAEMDSLVSSLSSVTTVVFPYVTEDIKSPRYVPITFANGEGAMVSSTANPAVRRIYLRLALREAPASTSSAAATAP